ncbi:hypothetical protein BH09BAC2_BH09BAC2_17710 [soil metagenome]
MRISWGYKIGLLYLFFVAGIMVLVVKSMSKKMDVVSGNYYAEELKYQDRIDDVSRAAALTTGIDIKVDRNNINVIFPKDFAGKQINGTADVYCPADENKDIKKTIETEENKMQIKLPDNAKGYFYVKINCSVEGKSYYFENKIYI